jgi:hypothetical protein
MSGIRKQVKNFYIIGIALLKAGQSYMPLYNVRVFMDNIVVL